MCGYAGWEGVDAYPCPRISMRVLCGRVNERRKSYEELIDFFLSNQPKDPVFLEMFFSSNPTLRKRGLMGLKTWFKMIFLKPTLIKKVKNWTDSNNDERNAFWTFQKLFRTATCRAGFNFSSLISNPYIRCRKHLIFS